MISDEDIALVKDYVDSHLGVTGEARAIEKLLAERELLVKEHRAMLPLIHGDVARGAIDPLFEAWGQVEAFK